MKKDVIILLCVTALSLILFSCGPKVIETETRQFNEKYYLTEDTTKAVFTIDIKVEIPRKFRNKDVLNIIRADLVEKIFGSEYTDYSDDELLPRFAGNMYTEYKASNLPFVEGENIDEIGYAFNNDYILETFGLLNDEHIFSYGTDLYTYTGGAHGLSNRLYYNYNLKTGEQILENDIFVEGSKDTITKLIKKHIIEDSEDIHSSQEFEETYWANEITPNGNFYITSESINYVFNPYEIAPYAYGHTEVRIPFDEIKSILKKDSPLRYLVVK